MVRWQIRILIVECFDFSPEEVQNIVSGKLALKYQGAGIEAMKRVALASKNRSLAEFQNVSNGGVFYGGVCLFIICRSYHSCRL